MKQITFKGVEYKLKRGTYQDNNNTALVLLDEDNELVSMATLNLGDVLAEDEAYIKDYSENSGMLEALEEAGVVVKVIGSKPSGFILAPMVKLDLTDIEELEG